MVVFDTSFLVVLLQETCPPVKDRAEKPVPYARERIQYLLQQLANNNSLVCIPTPVLAEIMVRAETAAPAYLSRLSNTSKFKLSTFDVKAAIESAELIRKIKVEQRAKNADPWAKVKFDIQIVAIAKAENASVIYADDPQIETHGARVSISVKRICDLALPPQQPEVQELLFSKSEASVSETEPSVSDVPIEKDANRATLQAESKESSQVTVEARDEVKSDAVPSVPVQGGDRGVSEDKTTPKAQPRAEPEK